MEDSQYILIVDDEPDARFFLEVVLGDTYDVETAENGEEAVQKILHAKPRLVLLDLMMPRMNGFQVIKVLQSMTALRDIPVFVISAVDKTQQSQLFPIPCVKEVFQKADYAPDTLIARIKAQNIPTREGAVT